MPVNVLKWLNEALLYIIREEVVLACFMVSISGSNSTVINFATETALAVEQVKKALKTVTTESGATFDEIAFTGEIETVKRVVELHSASFAQKVTKEVFKNITEVFKSTFTAVTGIILCLYEHRE